MDYDAQLKLQAWLDGELPAAEARKVTDWLAQDREAAALADELRNTRQALTGVEADIRLPESREFFWSKIQREIQRLEVRAPEAAPKVSPWALLRRWLIPASAVALVLVAGLVLIQLAGRSSRLPAGAMETALADTGALTYRDDTAGTTLVWLSYPADYESADDEEVGTID